MFSPAVWCIFALMETAVISTASNVSLSKGSLSIPSISTKLYLTSTDRVGSWLYIKKNGENFVDAFLLTICTNKTLSIIFGKSQGSPSRRAYQESLTVLFCRSQSLFDLGWYAEVIRPSTPIMLCKTLVTSFTNSLPWTLIWIFIHPCRHVFS